LSKTKPIGITSKVNRVEVTNPPMTTVANGGQISISRPLVKANGHRPATVVHVVIRTGLARSRTAAKAAAPAVHEPPRTRCCIRSTSKMAGLTVRPSRATTPTKAIKSAGVPESTSAQVAPRTVKGTAASTNTGIVRLSNVTANTAKSRSRTGPATFRNQLRASSFSTTPTVHPSGL
jgi:hypothetical protein